jgi:hypothetical protein
VDVRPGLADPVQQLASSLHVGAEALVHGRVEGHVAGAVDDRVQVGRQRRGVVQVALEHADARGHQRLDTPGRLDDVGEDRLLQQ